MKTNLFLSILFLAQSFASTSVFSQAPNLGANSGFALFTASGRVDILDSSTIWGKVGNNVGAYSKDTASIIHGTVHNADAISSQAATDVATAYSYLFNLTCGKTIAGTTRLGTLRTVLGPDTVFCLGGAQTLDGDLTLDAKNDPDAIFIIQIDAALSTNTSSRVLLINAASACNVYWQVNGAVSLGVGSAFKGTIVANGAISLLDGATLDGRALSKTGAISISNNIVTGCDSNGAALPVLMLSFSVKKSGIRAEINWQTATETNNHFFTIQRSKDGVDLDDIATIKGAGTSSEINSYTAFDNEPYKQLSYYRIKQTDFDGKTSYTDFVSFNLKSEFHFQVFPNPFGNSTTFQISNETQTADCELILINSIGKEVLKTTISKPLTLIQTELYLPGIYTYYIKGAGGILHSGIIILER
jgi:hypothetical protein